VIAEIAAANAAFQVIKTAIKNSGEIASAGKAIVDYFSATSKIEEEVKKAPEAKKSDLEEFLALEQLRKQEQELKELLIYQGRPGMWDDFQAFRVKARQNREAAEREKIRADLAEKARKKKNLENLMLTLWMFVLVVTILAISGFGLYLFLEKQ
jgi:vacuolar-type H+-ATPase subunit I/STV1